MKEAKAKDFQRETAERINAIFREGIQKRVLLSDEVGLGKTIVARTVVEMAKSLPGIAEDGVYRVVYVCSNQNIIRQNTRNLGIEDTNILKNSRLSMQHLILAELDMKSGLNKTSDELPEQLIPLTPATSFTITSGSGIVEERALIFVILKNMDEFANVTNRLSEILKTERIQKEETWREKVNEYEVRVNKCGLEYKETLISKLREERKFKDAVQLFRDNDGHFINKLREAFSMISLERLNPDLVIMDEFQRFSNLLVTKANIEEQTEEAVIAQHFFENDHPYILLLSATPYKPYTTLEELNENNFDEQYEDFIKLMSFLFEGEKSNNESFKTVWEDYSRKLSQISTDTFEILIASKKRAEEKMYNAMCRTERLRNSLVKEVKLDTMEITESDILSYCQMQKLLQDAKKELEKNGNIGFNPGYSIPIDYVKSSPYLLSFMKNYQEGITIKKAFTGKTIPNVSKSPSQRLLLKGNDISEYKQIDPGNARLATLQKMLFKNHAERLLWVPASLPYYSVPKGNVFALNKDFSKVLVFSAWEMVPRMLAIMLSYESERKNVSEAYKNEEMTYNTRKRIGENRMQEEGGDLLKHPSKYLADLFDYKKHFGKDIYTIIKEIKAKIESDINKLNLKGRGATSAKDLLNIVKCLEGGEYDEIRGVPNRAAETLAYMAIGSPAVCLYRTMSDTELPEDAVPIENVKEMTDKIVALFNKREASAAVELTTRGRKYKNWKYYEKVLHYCVMGNLQSVLDEFCHVIDEKGKAKNKVEKMMDSFISATDDYIHTTLTYSKESRSTNNGEGNRREGFGMRRNFAFAYGKITKPKDEDRNGTLQQAFNSPFRPFVLATTSVGQEGLDFHLYARKVVHWNLPSNPIDIEQREGRVNRYKCLAIRRNVAKIFSYKMTWKDMFDEADNLWRKKAASNYSEMIPYWCLPEEVIEREANKLEYIERIVPMYPLSIDEVRYKRLIDILSLYRLTMGQPRQEELSHLLEGSNITAGQRDELLFDLSPYNRNHSKNPFTTKSHVVAHTIYLEPPYASHGVS